MKFVTFRRNSVLHPGVLLDGDRVFDIASVARDGGARSDTSSLLSIIRGGDAALAEIRSLAARAGEFPKAILSLTDVKLEAPIPHPVRNVFCVGRNYVDHVAEGAKALGTSSDIPTVPQFFTKATHAVIGPDADVRFNPKVSPKMDYEVELGIVIGKEGRDIAPEGVWDHIFGYTIVNDVSARDLQRMHGQWFKGKSLDTTCPVGPCIVERADISDPTELELSITINGEERQRAHVRQMIFDIPRIVADLSAGMTLEAGDIIATGTPSGVGFAMDPPKWLASGDVMVCTISKIGQLKNRIVAIQN